MYSVLNCVLVSDEMGCSSGDETCNSGDDLEDEEESKGIYSIIMLRFALFP